MYVYVRIFWVTFSEHTEAIGVEISAEISLLGFAKSAIIGTHTRRQVISIVYAGDVHTYCVQKGIYIYNIYICKRGIIYIITDRGPPYPFRDSRHQDKLYIIFFSIQINFFYIYILPFLSIYIYCLFCAGGNGRDSALHLGSIITKTWLMTSSNTYIHTHKHSYTCIHTHTHSYTCIHTHSYTCIHTHINIHIHTYI